MVLLKKMVSLISGLIKSFSCRRLVLLNSKWPLVSMICKKAWVGFNLFVFFFLPFWQMLHYQRVAYPTQAIDLFIFLPKVIVEVTVGSDIHHAINCRKTSPMVTAAASALNKAMRLRKRSFMMFVDAVPYATNGLNKRRFTRQVQFFSLKN